MLNFRSWQQADLRLRPGPTALVGGNGQGKTNLIEALGYLSTLGSHRAATDAPLVRSGATEAVVQAAVVSSGRQLRLEVTINPGRANRARINHTVLPRQRELLGVLQTVLFAPEDLAMVRGDPAERRRFLDELLVNRSPGVAGVRADYDRALRQRTSLLKAAAAHRGDRASMLATLEAWDSQLVSHGAQLLAARLRLVDELAGPATAAYAALAPGPALRLSYRLAAMEQVPGATQPVGGDIAACEHLLAAAVVATRRAELERGVSLVGPHRDDLTLTLGDLPVRGYASHGESWSAALALRLASLEVLRADGSEPVLILDDVFSELDVGRRNHLVAVAERSEQVLVTAAVAADVPAALGGDWIEVKDGHLTAVETPTGTQIVARNNGAGPNERQLTPSCTTDGG